MPARFWLLVTASLLILSPPAPAFAAETAPRPDVPWITARTERTGRDVADDSLASLAVQVQLRFTRPPAADYELQAFFVVRDPDSKERVIYDATRLVTDEPNLTRTIVAKAPPAPAWFELPAHLTEEATGEPAKPTPTPIEVPPGARLEGWIVRVISAGKPVRLESNQRALAEWATKAATALDERARTARDLSATP